MNNQQEIWTIGHSNRSWETFVELLQTYEIENIVDVRRFPGSRKFPQYNQEELKNALQEIGISYLHSKKLGGRRKPNPDSKNTIWKNKSFRAYADFMETDEFHEGIKELKAVAQKKKTAYMCSEAVWWRCHRSMISDRLKADNWTVKHIMSTKKTTEHPYTKPAHIEKGKLKYGTNKKE